MAIARREPAPGIIHHSDPGVQYASSEYIDEPNKYGVARITGLESAYLVN
jgi:transposase InsO family protein